MVTAFKIKSAQAVSNSTLVIHRGALDTIEYADERNPYNPDTIHAIEYANRKKNKADTVAEKSPRYFNLIKKFQKRKTTYICLCVCVLLNGLKTSLNVFSILTVCPKALCDLVLLSQIVTITFSNLLGNTQACKMLFAFHGILCSTTVGRGTQLPAF